MVSYNKKHVIEGRQIIGGRAIVSKEIRGHSNDPFVVKKVEGAKAFFKRAGFPKIK